MRISLGLPTHRVDAAAEFIALGAVPQLARAAEEAGFAAVFVTDHPAPPADWIAGGGHHTLDPLITLGVAAAATQTLRLQTNLYVPAYRHPLLSAKTVATLDVLSGGRVILGVGAGYLDGEFAAVGADFEHRNDVLDDAIRTMRAAWTGQPVDGVLSLPRPVQQPGPPVWIGGNSKRAIRRAAELGDGWVPMPSPQKASKALRTPGLESVAALRDRIALLREAEAEAGRDRPLDIAFMPAGLDMFSRATPDHAKVVDELAALAEIGVTWATVTLPGETRAALLHEIETFGELVIRR
ncbi:MAG TPA: LLM class F420-dependent oxidoreductase [Mycobacteriales bacterium]|jgi:probable F420-dependent oxidoreductase|nr:LLM class F420-dependent oxidoreductase [Mycobacteriales bacterium]